MTIRSPVFELRVVLTAESYEHAVRFWRDTLGLPEIRSFDGPGGGGTLLAAGQATLEILARPTAVAVEKTETGRTGVPAPIRLALEVADADDLRGQIEDAGARAAGKPTTTPWGHRSVRLQGPEGIQFTLYTVLPPDEQAQAG